MQIKWMLCLIVLSILTACSKPPESVASHQEEQFKVKLDIFPEMQHLGSYELGDLIHLLMPEKDKNIGWDHLANEEIVWQNEAFKAQYNPHTENTESLRIGELRVHMLGERASSLKDRHYELPWTMTYKSISPKFGVETVELFAGTPEDICFGMDTSHCDFDILPSLKHAKLQVKKVCQEQLKDNVRFKAYQLSHRNKEKVYLLEVTDGGSGGSYTNVALFYMSNENEFCNKIQSIVI